MAEAVIERVFERFAADLLTPLKGSGPLTSRITETGRRLARFYQDGSVSCVLDTLSLKDGSPALRRMVSRAYDGWRDDFAAASREAGLPPSESRRRAEEAIMSIHGALVLARATGDRKPFGRVIARLPSVLTGKE
jgi:hypothetical protein